MTTAMTTIATDAASNPNPLPGTHPLPLTSGRAGGATSADSAQDTCDSDDNYDAVVVGSGLAGLSCAARLASLGQRVCVVEKSKSLGGHLLPFERAGATFEVGLHYIADTGPHSAFRRACESLGLEFEFIQLESTFEELRFEDGSCFFYQSPLDGFVNNLLDRFGKTHERALRGYARACAAAWDVANRVTFPCRSVDLFRVALTHPQRGLLMAMATQSLERFLDKSLGLPKGIREIISVQHLLMGVAPRKMSALLYLIVHRYYFENACFIRGGGREMIRQLLRADVTYLTGTSARVDAIDGAGAWVGTRARLLAPRGIHSGALARFRVSCVDEAGRTQRELRARDVVWTPDPRALDPRVQGRLGALTRFRLGRAEAPHALVVAYFATRRALTSYGFGNRNHWLMGTRDANACYEGSDAVRLAREGAIYVSTGSLRDPDALAVRNRLGAEGVFQAMFLCPADVTLWGGEDSALYRVPESRGGFGRAYRQKKDAALAALVARIEVAFPGVEGDLVWKELGTPLTHERFLHSPTRNGYGFAATVGDLLVGRPSYASGLEGLHFCGAHIKPAHGIVTALVNGVGLAERLST